MSTRTVLQVLSPLSCMWLVYCEEVVRIMEFPRTCDIRVMLSYNVLMPHSSR